MKANQEKKIKTATNPSKKPQPIPSAGTKRTSLENFLDGFPMDLAKQSLSTNLTELLRGGDISAYINVRLLRTQAGKVSWQTFYRVVVIGGEGQTWQWHPVLIN